MIFDLFHSISDPVVDGQQLGPKKCIENFLDQTVFAEALGVDTVWIAESHFSSETQKKTKVATIPSFQGEVGINSDSFQWFHVIQSRTKKINLGTGIHNIVGGSGGPIASADRVNTLRFINENVWSSSRVLRIGFASGRFPYQNTVFGINPRNEWEQKFWPILKRYLFLEALEIFLRLLRGEEISSEMLQRFQVSESEAKSTLGEVAWNRVKGEAFPSEIPKRWNFEVLKLVPTSEPSPKLNLVLGSSDPKALGLGREFWDLDLFNLSFTPPEEIEKLHQRLGEMARTEHRTWHRSRLPRTVLVFIDPKPARARELAETVLDSYIEAMRGTAQLPDKWVLMERALIGDAVEVREQIKQRFHPDDRLMLWFEFNQLDNESIQRRMAYFFKEVGSKL